MTEAHDVIARTFEPRDLEPLLEEAGVDTTILVQVACSDDDTDYLFERAAAAPWIGGVVAWVDSPNRPSRSRLEELAGRPALRGHPAPDPQRARPALDTPAGVRAGLASLEDSGDDPRAAVRLSSSPRGRARARQEFSRPDDRDRPSCETSARRDKMAAWAASRTPQPPSQRHCEGLRAEHDARTTSTGGRRTSDAVAVAVDAFGPERLVCGSDWPVALLNGDYEKVWRETMPVVRDVAPDSAEGLLAGNALRLYRLDATHRHGGRGRVMAALTDQAIAEIKNLIMSGEFVAGSRLPKEQDLRAAPRPVAQLAARGGARA